MTGYGFKILKFMNKIDVDLSNFNYLNELILFQCISFKFDLFSDFMQYIFWITNILITVVWILDIINMDFLINGDKIDGYQDYY